MAHPYCIHQDILDRMAVDELIRLTTTGTVSTKGLTDAEKEALVNWDIVDTLIEASDDTIDAYSSGHAALPLEPVSGLATNISATLSICAIWRRRPYASKARGTSTQTAVDAITESCRRMQKMLEQIAQGLLEIAPSPVIISENKVTYLAAKRDFTRTKMSGY